MNRAPAIPGQKGESMEMDVKVYAQMLIDKLTSLKDSNRNALTKNEIDTINSACNLIDHNREELKRI